jgi:hypothetical protein
MADANDVLNWKFPDMVLRRSLEPVDGFVPFDGAFFELTPGAALPTDAELAAIKAEYEAAVAKSQTNAAIKAQIATLEASCTERRWREAVMSDAGKAWLANVDAQIAALRASLQA